MCPCLVWKLTHQSTPKPRLFAIRIAGGIGSILEFEPITGAVKNQLASPVGTSISASAGLAFNGNDLYFLESITKRIYALNPDTGNVLRSLQLSGAGYDGLAFVGGKLYAQNHVNNTILEIDAGLTTVLRTLDINQINPNYLGATTAIDLGGALGENSDGTRLIVQTNNNSNSYLVTLPQELSKGYGEISPSSA